MLDEFKKCDIQVEDVMLNNLLIQLRDCFNKQQDSFVCTCKIIYKIWSYCKGKYWLAKDNEMYNSYKILEKFGFDKKAVARYKNCYERFIYDYETDNNIPVGATAFCKVCLKPEFENFSPSKLFELLPLANNTANEYINKKLITPEMTVKQIREFIKSQKTGETNTEQVTEDNSIKEEDIPMAYNPKQKYEFAYFESKTKNQLLNMIWELQKEYINLQKKLNKEKKENDTK